MVIDIRIQAHTLQEYRDIYFALESAEIPDIGIQLEPMEVRKGIDFVPLLEATITVFAGGVVVAVGGRAGNAAVDGLKRALLGARQARPGSRIWIREIEENFEDGALTRRLTRELGVQPGIEDEEVT